MEVNLFREVTDRVMVLGNLGETGEDREEAQSRSYLLKMPNTRVVSYINGFYAH
jgi:hypothetical protein